MVFLTAYGRCVTDQLGMLHASNSSCCQTVCEQLAESCEYCPDDLPMAARPDEKKSSGNHEKQELPTPCQLCFILNSDGMLVESGIKIPSPVFYELTNSPGLVPSMDGIVHHLLVLLHEELLPMDFRDPATGQHSLPLRLRVKTTPVRGPSLV